MLTKKNDKWFETKPQNKRSDLILVTALALFALLIGLAITV